MTDYDAAMLIGVDARPYSLFIEYKSRCPTCGNMKYDDSSYTSLCEGPQRGKLCRGKYRWWRPWGCRLFCRHFHAYCATCGDKWIMAPADVELFSLQ